MSDKDLDIEPAGNTLDGTDARDPDDAAEGAGEMLKARRPKAPKHQGRRGKQSDRTRDDR
jgi:hypothetical protein